MVQEKTIRKLVDYVLLNISSVNTVGLYNGKAGLSLSLFETSRFLQDESIEDKAFALLQESLLSNNRDFSFENGLSGIGYALIYLIENKFIDADFDDLFNEQYEKIITSNIEKYPDNLLNSMKVIYFLSIVRNRKKEDKRINAIIKKIFEGIELYLSIQFFDFKDIHYINNKTTVLDIFEIYLKLVDYSGYNNYSNALLNDYARLYNSGRIVSSLTVGFYLDKITAKCNINNKHIDIIKENINNGIKNIYPNTLFLDERLKLTKLIDNLDEYSSNLLLDIKLSNENTEQKIIKMIRPNSFPTGYQYGLARYLIFCTNKNAPLL